MKTRALFQYYRYLWRCAKKYLKKHNIYTIGVNGSVGKTSCRMIIHQTLSKALPQKKIYTSPKNFNGELWMSLSILQIESREPKILSFLKVWCHALKKAFFWKKEYDIIVLEYWIDRPKEMEFLVSINKPHIWVFTAIDAVHSEQFWNPSEIAKEEVKMVQNTREIAFLNKDDSYAQQLEWTLGIDEFTYHTLGWNVADIFFEEKEIKVETKNENLLLSKWEVTIKWKKYKVETNLLWKPNYWYLSIAVAIADIVYYKQTGKEFNLKDFLKKPLIYQLQPWRCSIFKGKHDSILVDSTYNASPLSMRKLIDTTLQIQKSLKEKRKILLVLWDMRELGDLTEKEHRLLAWYVQQSANHIVLIGNYMENYLKDELLKIGSTEKDFNLCKNSKEVWKFVDKFLSDSDEKWIILIKGSQNTIFLEEATKALLSDKSDEKYLTRQSKWRLDKKNASFN